MSLIFFVPGIPVAQGNLKPYIGQRADGKPFAKMTEGTCGETV